MTVSASYTPLTFNGNGSTTAFSVTWPFFTGSLVVTAIDADGVETVKTITTHYTVSGGTGSNGIPATGTVTMLTAPASGTQLRITRSTTKTQTFDPNPGGNFNPDAVEAAFDKALLIAQELANVNDEITGDFMTLNTAGADDYWDAEEHVIRNVADAEEDDEAVNKSQLDAATMGDIYFTQTGIGATERTWLSKMREIFSVKDFGAVGDDSNDDTAEIQAAIDACATAGGGTVFFPRGTYRVSDTLTVTGTTPLRLVGEGWSSVIHYVSATAHSYCIDADTDAGYFSVENLKFSTPSLTTVRAIRSQRSGPKFRDLYIAADYKHGILLLTAYGFDVHGCTFVSTRDYAIYAPGGSAQNATIDRCGFFDCGNDDSTGAVYLDAAEASTICNSGFEGNRIDVFLEACTSIQIDRNYMENGTGATIWMAGTCKGIEVTGTWFYHTTSANSIPIQNVTGFEFRGNTLAGAFSVTMGSGATNVDIRDNAEFTGWSGTLVAGNLKFLNEIGDAATNTVTQVAKWTHSTSGTAAASFGVGHEFELENGSGTKKVVGSLDWIFTDATNTSEDADFSVKLMAGGSAAAEKFRVASTGAVHLISGASLNIASSNWVATHTSGILTVGTGDLRVTTAGTNAASVVTVDGTQTLGNKTLTTPSITTSATITSTDAGATAGPILTLYRDSSTPAANDILGQVLYTGEDSGGGTDTYGSSQAHIEVATAGSETGILSWNIKANGNLQTNANGRGPFELYGYDSGSGTVNVGYGLRLTSANADGYSEGLVLRSARGTLGSPSLASANDAIYALFGTFHDGNDYQSAGFIKFAVDGTASAGDMPGRFEVWTTTDGGTTVLERLRVNNAGDVSIGVAASGSGQLHVVQHSATGAQPVLYLKQDDVDQQIMSLETTIGTGNAIEAVGAKTLTTTHFVKVTIVGVGDRYFPVGTIA